MRTQKGFTLIEMSIVLVIMALMIGGTLAGRSLIRQSQINSAMTDVQRYISATKAFQQKYGALPGDMPNATNYWGAQTTCPPAIGGSAVFGTVTCNGNGNGQIALADESILYWQHLADAQFISGSYTGIPGSGGSGDHLIGVNVPAVRIQGAGLGTYYVGNILSVSNWYNGNYGHSFFLGSYTSNNVPTGAILSASEAQSFDKKYDDGFPATGTVMTFSSSYLANCTTAASGATPAKYNTTTSAVAACSMIIKTGY